MQRFINRFQKRYDRRAVPLLEALDPEMGIGYDDMEQDFNAQGIVGDFTPPGRLKRTAR
ncbi:lantibiotic dehydratase family protein [Niabella sp. W65]|nr:lantibiotic dehydratase family protein [Niabella sp. W65]MCH7364074.1 lantibiotic dehydratase family protein [Niabella sp. W65]ULT39954.1 lantibiotic dehydratase family protein [Niabella sp. I65]